MANLAGNPDRQGRASSNLDSKVLPLEDKLYNTQQQLATALARVKQLEAASQTVVRFLDLPSEVRNAIYELAAKAAFEVPAKLQYTRHLEYNTTRRRRFMCYAHNDRRDAGSRNRLAMLYTNRQIYGEASQL